MELFINIYHIGVYPCSACVQFRCICLILYYLNYAVDVVVIRNIETACLGGRSAGDSMVEQQIGKVVVALLGSNVKRSVTVRRDGGYRSTSTDQQLDCVHVAHPRRYV